MKTRLIQSLITATLALAPAAALASVPSLQVAPLSYSGNLSGHTVESGFVDVANPTDETVTIVSDVQKFHQVDVRGDLSFAPDAAYSQAIKVGLSTFQLGPRQAVRVAFTINSSVLPKGGVYAAIFFRTQPPPQSSDSSFVVQSANVGTLLILTNGGPGAHRGAINSLDLAQVQLGGGISGSLMYQNTDNSPTAVGFDPALSTRVTPWGKAAGFTSGLVLPGSTRKFDFTRPGSFFGYLPVTVTDAAAGGVHATAWVFVDTGIYHWLVPLILVLLIFLVIILVKFARRAKGRAPAPQAFPESGGDHVPTLSADTSADVALGGSPDPELISELKATGPMIVHDEPESPTTQDLTATPDTASNHQPGAPVESQAPDGLVTAEEAYEESVATEPDVVARSPRKRVLDLSTDLPKKPVVKLKLETETLAPELPPEPTLADVEPEPSHTAAPKPTKSRKKRRKRRLDEPVD